MEPGLYWVKWAAGQDWDVGMYSGGESRCWWAIGTDDWQDAPEVIGPPPVEPKEH